MRELDEKSIDGVLRRAGYGFLGLATGDRPYVLPMAFGYDGQRLFFQMSTVGRKSTYLQSGGPATFNVVEVGTDGSRSILVEGAIERVPEAERTAAFEVLAETANFGDELDIWSVPMEEAELDVFGMHPDTMAGRSYGGE